MTMLEVSGISVDGSEGPVLNGITFVQKRGEHIAIAGETGSGKSTLLKVIAGLAQPDRGVVNFGGTRVLGALEKLVPGHRDIAYLSQQFELPKFLRVEQVLEYATALDSSKSDALYELCEISHLLKRRTDQLSGGERQRIALARLLSGSPELLLLDEPFSNLDMAHKSTLKLVLENVAAAYGITYILVSHEPADTLPWADRILILRRGEIVQTGTPREVYEYPHDEYCAGLFGAYSALTPTLFKQLGGAGVMKSWYRPRDFVFAADGARGTVIRRLYYGGHVDHEVELDGRRIWVWAPDAVEDTEAGVKLRGE